MIAGGGGTNMPATVTTTCLRRLRLVYCIVLSTIIVNPCLGEEDSHHPPLPDSNLKILDIGFKNDWKEAKEPIRCMQSCFPFDPVVAAGDSSDQTINYREDFKLEFGQSGPLSFRLTGRHLKMKVEF